MKIAIILCLVAVAAATSPEPPAEDAVLLNEEQLTQLVDQLLARADAIKNTLSEFRGAGVTQIMKLKTLIEANRHCSSIADIPSPVIPAASPVEEDETASATVILEGQAASNILHRLKITIATLEQKIARMRHVGKTQIEIFKRFTETVGDDLCPASSEGDD